MGNCMALSEEAKAEKMKEFITTESASVQVIKPVVQPHPDDKRPPPFTVFASSYNMGGSNLTDKEVDDWLDANGAGSYDIVAIGLQECPTCGGSGVCNPHPLNNYHHNMR